jgi:PKD repeat protein
MCKRFYLPAVIAAFMLVSMIVVPASGQTATVPDLAAARAAREQRSQRLVDALPAAAQAGVIAYVERSTYDIRVIAPDGSGDQVLWNAPQPLSPWPAFDLAWRPDGGELAFSSQHEEACSWFQSDVYAIRYNGTGYRRVTNSPACAELAALPKGSVTVNVTKLTSDFVQVYVAGAPGLQTVLASGTMTFDSVADFGPGVSQPAIGISGLYRVIASPPLADVLPGETVPGGELIIAQASGIRFFGTGKVSWKADGSALAYGMRTCADISQIPAIPPYGSIGEQLPVVEEAAPCQVAWGSTAATEDQYLYYSILSPMVDNIDGIYLNTVGDTSGGTKLVDIYTDDAQAVWDIEWLPDASGFLFTVRYWDDNLFDFATNLFEYTFDPPGLTQLTDLGDDSARAFSISPDGQYIVLERTADEFDSTSSLWIMGVDGSGLHMLVADAGRPAWGPAYVLQPVHAEFAATPASGVHPLLVQFTNQSTGDYDTCTWTFGDGGTSASCDDPTHTYAAKGVYTVALTVTGPGGTDTLTRSGHITVYDPVQADLSGSPRSGPPPLEVSFTNSSTGDFTSSLWDFGDGQTSTLKDPVHTYVDEGSYTVTLTVSGPGGTDTLARPGYIVTRPTYRVWLPLILHGQPASQAEP